MDYKEKYEKALERAAQELKADLHESGAWAIKRIFPELKESEEERTRKELVNFLQSPFIKENLTDEKVASWIAYLEKQEETLRDFIDNFPYSDEQKEQKPVEWSEVELEFRGEKVKVKRPFFRDDNGRGYSTTEQDEEVSWNALRAWCEKKGVSLYDLYPREEWSEEDKHYLNSVINLVHATTVGGSYIGDRIVNWLKNLPGRFNLEPKQEWSEEDEKKITFLERLIRYNVPEGQYGWTDGHRGGFITKLEAIAMLKSLRPSKK